MGCCGSTSLNDLPIELPNGTPQVFVHKTCMSTYDCARSGVFTQESQSVNRDSGKLFQLVTTMADKNLKLVASIPKIVMQTNEMKGKNQFQTSIDAFFSPSKGDEKIETKVVHAISVFDMEKKFFSGNRVSQKDGVGEAMEKYANEGWHLCGAILSVQDTSVTKYPKLGLRASSYAREFDLVFQRTKATSERKSNHSTFGFIVSMSVGMGGFKAKLPDFQSFLERKGENGWQMGGVAMLRPSHEKGSTKFDSPVRIFMHSDATVGQGKKKVYRFATPIFRYIVSIGSAHMEGDIVAFVKSWCDAGWCLKGAVNLPASPVGSIYSGRFQYPVMCFFEACEEGEEDGPLSASDCSMGEAGSSKPSCS
eukprot:g1134.t1